MKLSVAGITRLRRSTVLADAHIARQDAHAVVRVGAPVGTASTPASASSSEAMACNCNFNPWWLAASVGISIVAAVLIEFAVFPVLRKAL